MTQPRRWGSLRAELEARLSPAALDELIREFGGRVIRVPGPNLTQQRARQRRVVQLLGTDSTYDEVAHAVGASVSTVVRDAKRI